MMRATVTGSAFMRNCFSVSLFPELAPVYICWSRFLDEIERKACVKTST